MYIHQQDWASAMRVAEQFDPSSMSDVLVAQARVAVERKEYPRGEQLFLNAKKPELALRMYADNNAWKDAMRIAKKHLPHKVAEVSSMAQRAMAGIAPGKADDPASPTGGAGGRGDALAAAKMAEQGRDYARAITAYLAIGAEQISDQERLEECWMKAIQLASQHARPRYGAVVEDAAGKLAELGRHTKAAELYHEIERYDQAIREYCKGEAWNEARECAQSSAPHMLSFVESENTNALRGRGDAEAVASRDADAALEMYARRGDWAKLWPLAQKSGSAVCHTYAVQRANQLMEQASVASVDEAIVTLARYGDSSKAGKANLRLYQSVANSLLGRTEEHEEASKETVSVASSLVDVLQGVMAAVRSGRGDQQLAESMRALTLDAKTYGLYQKKKKAGDKEMVFKLACGMLRAPGVPVDKAFYLAGQAAKDLDELGLAFVLTNRYLDLSEAIDDQDMSMVDNADFAGTAIPTPEEMALPERQYLQEDKREEVRDWVLALSMNQNIEVDPADTQGRLADIFSEIDDVVGARGSGAHK